jgi:hypothetical protein
MLFVDSLNIGTISQSNPDSKLSSIHGGPFGRYREQTPHTQTIDAQDRCTLSILTYSQNTPDISRSTAHLRGAIVVGSTPHLIWQLVGAFHFSLSLTYRAVDSHNEAQRMRMSIPLP